MIEMGLLMGYETFLEVPCTGDNLEIDGELAEVLDVRDLEGDGADLRVWIRWI
jgi:hypothetical protein